jgi:hypothetical protein
MRLHELCWVFIYKIKILGQFRSTEPQKLGTTAPSGTAGPTLHHYWGSHRVKSCAPAPKRPNSWQPCWIKETHHRRAAQGPEAGPVATLGPATPARLAQTCHQAPVTSESTARNDPDRRNKVSLIQRLRLASLGFMDAQSSEQSTCDNIQDFIYPPEHDPEWMTRGPGPAAPRGPTAPPSRSQPTHNRLLTASGTKSRTHDRRRWESQGWPHLLVGHCSSLSLLPVPLL